jgi:hypothetical protein
VSPDPRPWYSLELRSCTAVAIPPATCTTPSRRTIPPTQRSPLPNGTPGSIAVEPWKNTPSVLAGKLSHVSTQWLVLKLGSPCEPIDAGTPVEFGTAVQ